MALPTLISLVTIIIINYTYVGTYMYAQIGGHRKHKCADCPTREMQTSDKHTQVYIYSVFKKVLSTMCVVLYVLYGYSILACEDTVQLHYK